MIYITIDGQQFEIGPDSMQVENEEVFELVKNSSRVFNSCSVNKIGPYVLEILSYDGSIKNFAFCLENRAQRQTYVYDNYISYISYRRKMRTLKHSKFQFQSESDALMHCVNNLVEVIYDGNRYSFDVSVVKGSYLSPPNIVVYTKMIRDIHSSLGSLWSLSPDRWYEMCIENLTLDSYFYKYEGLSDELTKLSSLPI